MSILVYKRFYIKKNKINSIIKKFLSKYNQFKYILELIIYSKIKIYLRIIVKAIYQNKRSLFFFIYILFVILNNLSCYLNIKIVMHSCYFFIILIIAFSIYLNILTEVVAIVVIVW